MSGRERLSARGERIQSLPAQRQTLIDRAVSYFSPARGAARLRTRMEISASLDSRQGMTGPVSGAWNGAARIRRQTMGWFTRRGSANTDTLWDLPALRERSADLLRNSPLSEGAVNTAVSNVVGVGLTVRPRVDRASLANVPETVIDAFEARAATLFKIWADSPNCEITRTNTFNEVQSLAFRSVLENGDAIAVDRFVERQGWPFGYTVQLIEGDRLSNPNRQMDTITMAGGVEIDAMGAPIAYHISDHHPGDFVIGAAIMQWTRVAAFGASGRRLVNHLFFRKRIDQARGVPFLSTVVESIKQLTTYSEAEIMAAVMNACFAIGFKSPTGDASIGMESDAPLDSTNGTGAAREPINITQAGMVIDLRNDESIEELPQGRPNAQFDPFVKSIMRQIGAALGIPYEVLVMHFDTSYSASRASLEMLWQFVRERRAWLSRKLCQPSYETFVAECVGRGMLDAPGFFDDVIVRAAWCGSAWIGSPKPSLDLLKDANAYEKMIGLGAMSIDDVTTETSGASFADKHRQRVKEHAARAAAGLEAPVLGVTVRLTGNEALTPTEPAGDPADAPDDGSEPDDA